MFLEISVSFLTSDFDAKVGTKKNPQRVATCRATLRIQRLYTCISEYLAP
jgi:hypothetical protein